MKLKEIWRYVNVYGTEVTDTLFVSDINNLQ